MAYKPYSWPWRFPSILTPVVEEKPDSWLDTDLEEDDDSEDYAPELESDETSSENSEFDSNDGDIGDWEVAALSAHAYKWRRLPLTTDFELAQEERDNVIVKAEQEAAAAYDPDEVV